MLPLTYITGDPTFPSSGALGGQARVRLLLYWAGIKQLKCDLGETRTHAPSKKSLDGKCELRCSIAALHGCSGGVYKCTLGYTPYRCPSIVLLDWCIYMYRGIPQSSGEMAELRLVYLSAQCLTGRKIKIGCEIHLGQVERQDPTHLTKMLYQVYIMLKSFVEA